jgi:hypothetical protein
MEVGMSYYVLEVWDAEGIHGQGTLALVHGNWSSVVNAFRGYGINTVSDMENIYGDRIYWYPKVKRYICPKHFILSGDD